MKPIALATLLGNIADFSPSQVTARQTYIKEFPEPPSEWLCEDDPVNSMATGMYNTLVESGGGDPRFPDWDGSQMGGSFADVLKYGGDALVWTLIRIGLDESLNEDVVGLCERRGFVVCRTSLVDNSDPFAPATSH
jgi:hypothetical protein